MTGYGPLTLILSEDAAFLRHCGDCLDAAGFRIVRFSFVEAAVEFIRNADVTAAVLLTTTHITDIQKANSRLPILLPDCNLAAWPGGLVKSFGAIYDSAALIESVRQSHGGSRRGAVTIKPAVNTPEMVGRSARVCSLRECIARIAASDSNVLITGETGTGKELVAALVHANSRRCEKPFVCVNCAAVPDNLVESELFGYERGAFTGAVNARDGHLKMADGGSVFLDEIGDISQYAQAKLLRVIENKQVQRLGSNRSTLLNVRFIAATNRPLRQMVGEGRFREDLYFRLDVAHIHLPPLRERTEDIPLLLQHYIREMNTRFERDAKGFTDEALDCLTKYDWPGNIRELKNLLEGIYINLPDGKVSLLDLPERIRESFDAAANPDSGERERLLSTLLETKWNKSKAAEKLNWSRMTLYRKLAKYQLSA